MKRTARVPGSHAQVCAEAAEKEPPREGYEMAAVTEQAVIDALRMVMEPELHKDLITLNMVKDIQIQGGAVKFTVVLTTPACPLKTEIKASCDKAVGAVAGVTKVDVNFTANVQQGRSQIKDNLIPTVKNTIAISSGKGGVGKTTVAVNLAVGLVLQGAKVGLMDADVYGPNVPMMMGVERPPEQRDGKLAPAESHGVKLISMGFFVPDDQPLTWRGPMIHTAIQQFLREDRKSTRLNSSHLVISYAVFCLKKKKTDI